MRFALAIITDRMSNQNNMIKVTDGISGALAAFLYLLRCAVFVAFTQETTSSYQRSHTANQARQTSP